MSHLISLPQKKMFYQQRNNHLVNYLVTSLRPQYWQSHLVNYPLNTDELLSDQPETLTLESSYNELLTQQPDLLMEEEASGFSNIRTDLSHQVIINHGVINTNEDKSTDQSNVELPSQQTEQLSGEIPIDQADLPTLEESSGQLPISVEFSVILPSSHSELRKRNKSSGLPLVIDHE